MTLLDLYVILFCGAIFVTAGLVLYIALAE